VNAGKKYLRRISIAGNMRHAENADKRKKMNKEERIGYDKRMALSPYERLTMG
jgi:hypothetical protein